LEWGGRRAKSICHLPRRSVRALTRPSIHLFSHLRCMHWVRTAPTDRCVHETGWWVRLPRFSPLQLLHRGLVRLLTVYTKRLHRPPRISEAVHSMVIVISPRRSIHVQNRLLSCTSCIASTSSKDKEAPLQHCKSFACQNAMHIHCIILSNLPRLGRSSSSPVAW
jgi:hypothetical protein